MPRIVLQRHTHPDIEAGICYGWSDIGVRAEYQSRDLPAVVERYKTEIEIRSIERIYSSPLRRCSHLAQDLQRLTSASQIIYDDRLKELNFGSWESQSWDEIYKIESNRAWFDDYINISAPNGESFIDLLRRAESFLRELKERGEDALVVTHSGFIRSSMVVIGRCKVEGAFDDELEYGGAIEIKL